MTADEPLILFVDDATDRLASEAAASLGESVRHYVIHPEDLDRTHLLDSDLVLVDYRLEAWSEARDRPISCRPVNGMALAGALREVIDHSIKRKNRDRVVMFALHTSHLAEIHSRFPTPTAEHVVAQLSNLEWVFSKAREGRYERMVTLARAARQLPANWPSGPAGVVGELHRLLDMDQDCVSFDRCWREVVDCRVPLQELIDGMHGIHFIRWLLHSVLPYPCFLWERHWVAARLGIEVSSLEEVLRGESMLSKDLAAMRFSGVLDDFLGARWWRAAIEDYAWRVSAGDDRRLAGALNELAGMKLEEIPVRPAVVGLSGEFEPNGEFLAPEEAVALRPDHWPSFADAAWMDLSAVREDLTLRTMVDPLDVPRMGVNNYGIMDG